VIVFTVIACSFGLVKAVGALSTFAIDLEVYRAAGRAVLQGNALYEHPLVLDERPWALPFTYPPWAAILFTPLALLSAPVARFAIVIANDALLVFVAFRSWQVMRPATDRRRLLLLAVLTASLLFLTEAVHYTVYNGQVNLLVLALVLGDLIRGDDRRTKGTGLGIAAGIKLTPLIFVPYLLATRRLHAAVVATTTFLGTVAVGFLILPHDSAQFWLAGTLTDVSRIYPNTTSTHNQSVRGMLLRSGMSIQSVQLAWLTVAMAIGVLTILVAVWATRRGLHLLALTLCGLSSAALSPWAWGHHWVWLIPLAVSSSTRQAGTPATPRIPSGCYLRCCCR
jgi:alpha-1,2-mannosyltransferase